MGSRAHAHTTLIGGGRDAAAVARLLAGFRALAPGVVACVVVDEGEGVDERRWSTILTTAGVEEVRVCAVRDGRPLRPADVAGCDGVFVAGGHTPRYAQLVVPAAGALAALPYAGFSAGAAIAAQHAIIGGWRAAGRPIAPEDTGEDLEELTIVPGLGRVPFSVDVHASAWGTLGRAIHAVASGATPEAYAIDEHTALLCDGATTQVVGEGAAYRVAPDGAGGATVRTWAP